MIFKLGHTYGLHYTIDRKKVHKAELKHAKKAIELVHNGGYLSMSKDIHSV
jgi:hypothetical protein